MTFKVKSGVQVGSVLALDANGYLTTRLATARTISLGGDLSGSAAFDGSGDITITAAVADDSHTHDGRYYTETEADSRFVNVTGDTMSGALTVSTPGSAASLTVSGQAANIYMVGDNTYRWIAGHSPDYGVGSGFGLYSDTYGAYYLSLSTSGNWYMGVNDHGSSYRLSLNGTGYASNDFRSPIFYDSNDTGYYVDPASTSNINALTTNGRTILGGQLYVSSVNSNTLNSGYSGASDGYDIWINYRGYNDGQSYYRNFNVGDGKGTNIIWASGPGRTVTINNGQTFTYSIMDNTPVVGSATNNKLEVNGSIQLTGNNDAIVFGRGTATFLKDEELGFGWGGGWYMTDSTYLRVRGSKTLYNDAQIRSDSDMRAPIFYDYNDTGYYVDPASTSVMNQINLNTAGTARMQWRPAGSGTIGVGIPALNASFGSINIEVADNDSGGIIIDNEGVTTYGAGDTGWIFRAIDEDVWQTNGNNVDAATIFGVGQGATGGIRVYGAATLTQDVRSPIYYNYSDTSYYWDPGTSSAHRLQTPSGYLDLAPMNSSWCHFQTDRPKFYFGRTVAVDGQLTIYGDESNRFYQGGMVIRGSSPTIYFRDTDNYSSMIHCNSNLLYILRGSSVDSESWATVNGYWPAYWDMTNNNATFGGSLWCVGNVTAYSDRKLKENIVTVDNALNKVLQLRGVYYNRIDDESKTRKVGFVAQEIQEVLPEVVQLHQDKEDPEGTLAVDYGNITGLLVEAIKEQQEYIESQETRIARLEALVQQLIGD